MAEKGAIPYGEKKIKTLAPVWYPQKFSRSLWMFIPPNMVVSCVIFWVFFPISNFHTSFLHTPIESSRFFNGRWKNRHQILEIQSFPPNSLENHRDAFHLSYAMLSWWFMKTALQIKSKKGPNSKIPSSTSKWRFPEMGTPSSHFFVYNRKSYSSGW